MPSGPREGLTRRSFVCFIVKSETHGNPQSPRRTRRRTALHHPDPPRLLAPSPHPPSHRLCRLRPRTRPPVWVLTVSYPGGRTKQISLSAEQKNMVQHGAVRFSRGSGEGRSLRDASFLGWVRGSGLWKWLAVVQYCTESQCS